MLSQQSTTLAAGKAHRYLYSAYLCICRVDILTDMVCAAMAEVPVGGHISILVKVTVH